MVPNKKYFTFLSFLSINGSTYSFCKNSNVYIYIYRERQISSTYNNNVLEYNVLSNSVHIYMCMYMQLNEYEKYDSLITIC